MFIVMEKKTGAFVFDFSPKELITFVSNEDGFDLRHVTRNYDVVYCSEVAE